MVTLLQSHFFVMALAVKEATQLKSHTLMVERDDRSWKAFFPLFKNGICGSSPFKIDDFLWASSDEHSIMPKIYIHFDRLPLTKVAASPMLLNCYNL